MGTRLRFHNESLLYLYAGPALPRPVLKNLILLKVIQWFNVGLLLDLETYQLKTIQKDCGSDLKACCREMFDLWLQSEQNPNYQHLLEVLSEAEERDAARQLQQWFGKSYRYIQCSIWHE